MKYVKLMQGVKPFDNLNKNIPNFWFSEELVFLFLVFDSIGEITVIGEFHYYTK